MAATFVNCDDGDDLTGRVFISGVRDFSGKLTAVAIDFVPDHRGADLRDVRLNVESNVELTVDRAMFLQDCLRLPTSGRLTLFSSSGELTSDARVRVAAVLFEPEQATSDEAGAGGALTEGRDECAGELLDDAVWPNVGASVPPPAASGGTSPGGAAGAAGAPFDGGAGGVTGIGGDGGGGIGGSGAASGGGSAGDNSGGSAGDNSGGGGSSEGGVDGGGASGAGAGP